MAPHVETSYAEPEVLVPSIKKPYKRQILWFNVFLMIFFHLGWLYGLYLLLTVAKWQTWILSIYLYIVTGLGVTGGAHRLWTHHAWKAKLPAKLIFVVLDTMAMHTPVIDWVRDHRVHHKYSDTDADPHNASRGFFFSHIGWLMVKKHPDVIEKGKKLDLSDLYSEPLLVLQRKYYLIFGPLLCFVMPTVLPWYCWGESLWVAYFTAGIFRYVCMLHASLSINSFAHFYGKRPYDKAIRPCENLVCTIATWGEGWHNFHHAFPYDYRASEHGEHINFTTTFIQWLEKLGWAYDLRKVSDEAIRNQKLKHGEQYNNEY